MKKGPETQKEVGRPVVRTDEIAAEEIRKIAAAVRTLLGGPLRLKTVLVLLSHETGLSQKQCKAFLDALHAFDITLLKPR